METVEFSPRLLERRRGVAFGIAHRNNMIDCAITLAALEMYFWLEPRASDVES
jgi:hypothetical protein